MLAISQLNHHQAGIIGLLLKNLFLVQLGVLLKYVPVMSHCKDLLFDLNPRTASDFTDSGIDSTLNPTDIVQQILCQVPFKQLFHFR